jgi:CheY-like chemotaxis protein
MQPRADSNWILVVEDDDAIRETMREILEDEGYRVATAANGVEGLARLRAESARPAVILLDVIMPVMDGWGFREAQMRDPTLGAIPVVVLSSIGSVDAMASALRAAGHLKKPVSLSALLGVVAAHARAEAPGAKRLPVA